MKDDLFTTQPQDIMIEIMRRLEIRSVMRCRCVCKSWRHLIETMYTPKQGRASYTPERGLAFALVGHEFKVCDEDFRPLLRVGLPVPDSRCVTKSLVSCFVIDSANGLLLVWNEIIHNLSVCNPMTREYAVLPPLPIPMANNGVIFGFGASKISGQYKILYGTYESLSRSWSCYVYTLGGSWRSLAVPALDYRIHRLIVAPFFNGNLQWLTSDLSRNLLMCCFDLETELFTNLSLPDKEHYTHLRILEDRLCLCSCYASRNSYIVIWRMNSYGDTNSWSKEYTFDNLPHNKGLVYPLKVLANDDLLYAVQYNSNLFTYSKNTKTIATNGLLQGYDLASSNISFYTPSFLSLTAMGIHNVESLKGKIFPYSL